MDSSASGAKHHTKGTIPEEAPMAIIKTAEGKEHRVQIAGVKVGDKVDCHVEGGKTSCHKLGQKH